MNASESASGNVSDRRHHASESENEHDHHVCGHERGRFLLLPAHVRVSASVRRHSHDVRLLLDTGTELPRVRGRGHAHESVSESGRVSVRRAHVREHGHQDSQHCRQCRALPLLGL